jgi:UDP-3-O-[3-hydroxymyristoyl] glucosamine N-acyltransferase
MKKIFAVAAVLSLVGCNSVGVMPDGKPPLVYEVREIMSWPVVDEARQFNPETRIYIDPTARVSLEAKIGANSKIGARTRIEEDSVVYPNVTIEHDVWIGEDAVIQSDAIIGHHAKVGGDAKVGFRTVVEPHAIVMSYKKVPAGQVIAATKK